MFEFISKFFQSLAKPKLTDTVSVNDEELVRTVSDGTVQRVLWRDIQTVTIVTTDQGPWLDDVFFVFAAKDSGVVIAQEWDSRVGLFDFMSKKLKGLDYESMIRAMGSTDNASFPIWACAKPGNEIIQ